MTDTSGSPQITDVTPLVDVATLADVDDQTMIDTLRRIADKLGHDLVQRGENTAGAGEKVIRL